MSDREAPRHWFKTETDPVSVVFPYQEIEAGITLEKNGSSKAITAFYQDPLEVMERINQGDLLFPLTRTKHYTKGTIAWNDNEWILDSQVAVGRSGGKNYIADGDRLNFAGIPRYDFASTGARNSLYARMTVFFDNQGEPIFDDGPQIELWEMIGGQRYDLDTDNLEALGLVLNAIKDEAENLVGYNLGETSQLEESGLVARRLFIEKMDNGFFRSSGTTFDAIQPPWVINPMMEAFLVKLNKLNGQSITEVMAKKLFNCVNDLNDFILGGRQVRVINGKSGFYTIVASNVWEAIEQL